jgi:hypothetical protein
MKEITNLISILSLVALQRLVFPKEARAYIDPSTGSFFTQAVLGLFLGGIFAVKIYWKKITNLFKRTSNKKNHEESKLPEETS